MDSEVDIYIDYVEVLVVDASKWRKPLIEPTVTLFTWDTYDGRKVVLNFDNKLLQITT